MEKNIVYLAPVRPGMMKMNRHYADEVGLDIHLTKLFDASTRANIALVLAAIALVVAFVKK